MALFQAEGVALFLVVALGTQLRKGFQVGIRHHGRILQGLAARIAPRFERKRRDGLSRDRDLRGMDTSLNV